MRWLLTVLFCVVTTVAISALFANTAMARTFLLPNGTQGVIVDPPAKWLGPSSREMLIAELPQFHLAKICTAAVGEVEDLACAFSGGGVPCTVLMADNVSKALREFLMQHEAAHCNGWPADHPLD